MTPRWLVSSRTTTGCNINHQEQHKRTGLEYVSGHTNGENADLVKFLLQHGADAQSQNSFGCSPLNEACMAANLESARVLLLHAYPDAAIRAQQATSSLEQVCILGRRSSHDKFNQPNVVTSVLKLLIEVGGANVNNVQPTTGKTPLMYCVQDAAWTTSMRPEIMPGILARMKTLIEHGA